MRALMTLAGAAFLLAGCLAGRQVITVSYTPEDPKPEPIRSYDYERAARVIAYTVAEQLNLPRFETVLYFYPSLKDYEAGFITELEAKSELASARSHALAIANCKYKKVLVNGHWFSRVAWPNRVKTLAHEMTHMAEFQLGNWRCIAPHAWLTEGFAHWSAYKVVEKLGLDTFAAARNELIQNIADFKSGRTLPQLSRLASPADWDYNARSLGLESTYAQAFLAVDYLIERKGLSAVLNYFALFERSRDRADNFKTAFGEDVSVFDADFGAHLKKILM
jgi:hypothetical protein